MISHRADAEDAPNTAISWNMELGQFETQGNLSFPNIFIDVI